MNARTIELTLPLLVSASTSGRMVAFSALGGAVGAAVAAATGVFNAVPILVGIVAGLTLSSPHRPRTFDILISRLLFALGLASLAGISFAEFESSTGWCLAVAAALAGVGAAPGLNTRRLFWAGALAAVVVGGAYALATFVGSTLVSQWFVDDVWVTAVAAGVVGAGGALASGVMSNPSRPDHRAELPAQAEVIGDEAFGGDFQEEWTALAHTAEGVERLLDRLAALRPDDAVLLDELRAGVGATVSAAERGLARWRLVDREAEAARVARLQERVDRNRAVLDAETDPQVAASIEATLARQDRALEALRAVEASRRTFAFRLEEAEASLEVLRLEVERALTAGDDLDHAELDTLVDALGDAHALFEEAESAVVVA